MTIDTLEKDSTVCVEIYGCMDSTSNNYNPFATDDDGSCYRLGCTDSLSDNYDSLSTIDDSSCFIMGCTNSLASNYNPNATINDSTCILGITELGSSMDIRVFPNPFTGTTTIEIKTLNHQKAQLQLTNMLGSIVWTTTTTKSQVHLDGSVLPKGLYLLRVQVAGNTKLTKLIIQ